MTLNVAADVDTLDFVQRYVLRQRFHSNTQFIVKGLEKPKQCKARLGILMEGRRVFLGHNSREWQEINIHSEQHLRQKHHRVAFPVGKAQR